jgi:AcrR family transcriptional regulator
MSKRRYRAGMDAPRIIRAATVLSHQYGLEGWSLRQLTALLDTSPSVVFHHVGDRAAISEAVVSRITEGFRSPSVDLSWSQWVRGLAVPLRRQLAHWPGVADWLVTRGPVFPHMMPLLEDGMFVLTRDGFGDEAATAYSMFYAAVIGSIAQSQVREQTPSVGAYGHRAIAQQLTAASAGAGVAAMRDSMAAYIGNRADAEAARESAHAYLVDRLIDGLEHRRLTIRAS